MRLPDRPSVDDFLKFLKLHLLLFSSSPHLLENIVSHSLNCIHVSERVSQTVDIDSDLFLQAAVAPPSRNSTHSCHRVLMDLATLKAATAPSKRGLKMREVAQNKRLKRHQENESNRPEDRRLLTRKDFNDIAVRFVCAATLHAYAYIVRWFEQFTTE